MPIIPTYPYPAAPQAAREKTAPPRTERDLPSLQARRGELLTQLAKQYKERGAVSLQALEQFANTRFAQETLAKPELADYALIRQAVARQESAQQEAKAQQALEAEEKWLLRAGEAACGAPALQAYLQVRLADYQTHLARAGLCAQQQQERVQNLREQIVQRHIHRSLAEYDFQAAQQVLTQQKKQLHPSVYAQCAQQLCRSFAVYRARQLFSQALAHTRDGAAALARARAKLDEPDEGLKAQMLQTLEACSQAQQRQTAAGQADEWEKLSRLALQQAQDELLQQTHLQAEQLTRAQQAVLQLESPAAKPDAAQFVKLYFSGGEEENFRAFEKGICSGKDYMLLEASRQRRLAGKSPTREELLCRAIEVWLAKKGFSPADTRRVQYEVLSSGATTAQQAAAWKEVQQLFNN